MGRPRNIIEYPSKKCVNCDQILPLNDFRRQIEKHSTICHFYYSSACRACLYIKHGPAKRDKEKLDKYRKQFRDRAKRRQTCCSCGEKLIVAVHYCQLCYVWEWMRKQRFYIKKQYNREQKLHIDIQDLFTLPNARKYPEFRLTTKIAPSIHIPEVLTVENVMWSNKPARHKWVKRKTCLVT